MYQPELLTCPHGGDLLVMWTSLTWEKTVQRLDGVLSVASRPGHGPHVTGAGFDMRRHAAEGQRLAPPGSPSSDDGLGWMGWWRQQSRATYRERPTEWALPMRLSAPHGRYRYHQLALPLLACHERPHRAPWTQRATQQSGLCIALDGRAPQGGEPPMGCIRARTSGLTFRRGGLSPQDHPTFEAFRAPLTHLAWPMLAGLSAQQTGWAPAVATGLPARRDPWGQAPALRPLAAPLAAVDAACQMALRKTVRQQVGDVIRQAPHPTPGPQLFRPTRDLLTLKGRPPWRLAGMETSARLDTVARCGLDLLAQRYEPRLVPLVHGLQAALAPCAQTSQERQQGAAWLRDLADL